MPKREKPLFWKTGAPWPAQKTKPDHWVSWAVVSDQWKLVTNRDLSHTELYNISADEKESSDLQSAEPAVVEALLGKLKDWQASLPEKPTGNVFSNLRKELPDRAGKRKK